MEHQGYVDSQYYKDTYSGVTISDDVLEQRLIMASHDIDSLTYNRILKVGFDNLTNFQKEIIQKSVCLHADFLHQYGEFLDLPISSYSAGSTSVGFKELKIEGQNGVATTHRVFTLLKQTGLTVRLFL